MEAVNDVIRDEKITYRLPISQYYYLIYDMGNETVTFVDLQLPNETEMFIDGPELGRADDKSAGHLHQISSQ